MDHSMFFLSLSLSLSHRQFWHDSLCMYREDVPRCRATRGLSVRALTVGHGCETSGRVRGSPVGERYPRGLFPGSSVTAQRIEYRLINKKKKIVHAAVHGYMELRGRKVISQKMAISGSGFVGTVRCGTAQQPPRRDWSGRQNDVTPNARHARLAGCWVRLQNSSSSSFGTQEPSEQGEASRADSR